MRPRWLYFGMILSVVATTTVRWAVQVPVASMWVQFAGREIAYLLATYLCLRIAAEYRRQPMLRAAWLLLAANGAVSLARHVLELSNFEPWPEAHLWRHIAITVALLLLLGGIWTMARGFLRSGLGFHVQQGDVLAIAVIFGLLSVILLYREYLSEAHAGMLAPRAVQIFSQIVIALAAASSVALHRIILEMGGGKLATAMKFLVGHIVGRVLLVLLGGAFRPPWFQSLDWPFVVSLCFDVTIWVFALAAAYRANMFDAALQQRRPRPEEILALRLEERWTRTL